MTRSCWCGLVGLGLSQSAFSIFVDVPGCPAPSAAGRDGVMDLDRWRSTEGAGIDCHLCPKFIVEIIGGRDGRLSKIFSNSCIVVAPNLGINWKENIVDVKFVRR